MRERFRLFLSICWISFAFAKPLVAGENLSLQSLAVDEMQTFVNCKRNFFDGDVCKRLVNKICTMPENVEVWQCLENAWTNCLATDFSTPACQKTVEKVCTATKNNYHYVCDRTRYETCLKSEFKAEGCQDDRITFTLPILKKDIERHEASPKTRPADLEQTYCGLSAQDPTSPLAMVCQGQDLTLDSLLLAYGRLKKTDPKAVVRLFQTFAAHDLGP
ncbi:MAG: hypothetical protein M3Q07_07310, partial [Pseudobdellovibrionaceae bacterium]|nr:hypothetical protein [Pseudobdellovibrionaceae bacterium]